MFIFFFPCYCFFAVNTQQSNLAHCCCCTLPRYFLQFIFGHIKSCRTCIYLIFFFLYFCLLAWCLANIYDHLVGWGYRGTTIGWRNPRIFFTSGSDECRFSKLNKIVKNLCSFIILQIVCWTFSLREGWSKHSKWG